MSGIAVRIARRDPDSPRMGKRITPGREEKHRISISLE
jgi:hypothetical protein